MSTVARDTIPSVPATPSSNPEGIGSRTAPRDGSDETEDRSGDRIGARSDDQSEDREDRDEAEGSNKKWWLVGFGLLGVGILVSALIYVLRPQPEPQETPERRPLVDVTRPTSVSEAVWVTGHGVTEAVHEVGLATEVSGRITKLHPAMKAGGVFEEGDVLLRIERGRYVSALRQARSEVRATRAALELAEIQSRRTKELLGKGYASQSELDETDSRVEELRSRLQGLLAQVSRAELDLEDTTLEAPFDGRVREVMVGPGQYVAAGSQVAEVYPGGIVEIEVRLSPEDAALLGPLWSSTDIVVPLPARVRTIEGDDEATWSGVVVRTSSNYDPQAQTLGVVVAVENPDPEGGSDGSLPLLPGRFVDVAIAVPPNERLLALDPEVLRADERVWVVQDETLRIVPVEVVYRRPDRVYVVGEGLGGESRLVTSDLDIVTEGMPVRPRGDDDRGPA